MEALERLGDEAERALLSRARAGERAARDELYVRFRGTLEAYLGRKVGARLGRAVSLSDLSQDSFLQALGGLERLPERATFDDFRGLLFQHARWVLGKQVDRHRDFVGESIAGEGAASGRAQPGPESAGSVTQADETAWLVELVEALPKEQADVVRLRLEGLSFSEVAERLGIREGSARQRYLRGSRELRRRVEGGPPTD